MPMRAACVKQSETKGHRMDSSGRFIGSVIAERTFEFVPNGGGSSLNVLLRIGEPRRSGEDWFVPYEIVGPKAEQRHAQMAWGVDALQALIEALWIVPSYLSFLEATNDGRLRYHGGEDLDLYRPPPAWIPVPWRQSRRDYSRFRRRGR